MINFPLPQRLEKVLKEIIENYKEGMTTDPEIGELRTNIIQLQELGYLKNFQGYTNGGFSVNYSSKDLDYDHDKNEYEKQIKAGMQINNYGGQQIIATNNSSITNTNQNSGIDINLLEQLISAIRINTPDDIDKSILQDINDSIETITEQLKETKPKESLIRTAIKTLKNVTVETA